MENMLILILTSFAGGVFGSMLGVIGSFSFFGAIATIGVASSILGSDIIIDKIAFGSYLGPHIAFASAVAALAYAGSIDLVDGSKDVLLPLYKTKRTGVMLVGGICGVVNLLIYLAVTKLSMPIDNIALTVIISNIIARLLFNKNRNNPSKDVKERISPKLENISLLIILGFIIGILSSYATKITGNVLIGYSISAFTLIFMFFDEIPPTHHVAIVSSYVVSATNSILAGGLVGIIAILLGEFLNRFFNTEADTYIDHPAATIAILSLIIFSIAH
ncbi:MAG TPA: hypothetical protein GX534_05975 [Thermoanaerobacterales bacterium]|jgi:hypothetical protein|nr:hypothetical protein [Thermoanaerobacterales bacterium]